MIQCRRPQVDANAAGGQFGGRNIENRNTIEATMLSNSYGLHKDPDCLLCARYRERRELAVDVRARVLGPFRRRVAEHIAKRRINVDPLEGAKEVRRVGKRQAARAA